MKKHEVVTGKEQVMSKAKKIKLGYVYLVPYGGARLPVRADYRLGRRQYEGKVLYPPESTKVIPFGVDEILGEGVPEDQWWKEHETGKQDRQSQAVSAAGRREGGARSGLEAAAKVLAEAGEPLHCRTIVERALEKGYWKTGGKTPAATVYAAILREIQKKGDASRFARAERGMFTLKA